MKEKQSEAIPVSLAEALSSLSIKRFAFHSEADFQFSLALELNKHYPEWEIRLEYPDDSREKRRYFDLYLTLGEQRIPIELKYKTGLSRFKTGKEEYSLKEQSAEDLGRLNFLQDVERLEQMDSNPFGYAVLLTNVPAYWETAKRRNTRDSAFRLHEGRTVEGTLLWGKGEDIFEANTVRLKKSYLLNWTDYSKVDAESNNRFRYLLLEV